MRAETLKRIPVMNAILANDAIHYFDQITSVSRSPWTTGLSFRCYATSAAWIFTRFPPSPMKWRSRRVKVHCHPTRCLGGTFTISVLGVVDGFTPILNRPQSAILGVGRSVQKPVVVRGEVVVREMMTLSLTADHQVIDGAVAAGFMRRPPGDGREAGGAVQVETFYSSRNRTHTGIECSLPDLSALADRTPGLCGTTLYCRCPGWLL